jgi:hypothetical protein
MITKIFVKNSKSKVLIFSALLFISIFSVLSCIDKEYDYQKMKNDIEINPDLALTIGSVTVELDSLIKNYKANANIEENPDGSMIIIFEKDLQSFTGEQKLALPSQTSVSILPFGFPATIGSSGKESSEQTVNVPITFLSDQQITKLLAKTFSINLTGNSSYPFAQELSITFTDMKKSGTSYVEQIPFSSNEKNKNYVTADKTKGADYLITFTTVGTGSSTIPVKVKLTLTGTPGAVIPLTSRLDVTFKINELTYRKMYGYIGESELLNTIDTMDVSFFSHEMSKNIKWKDPQIKIYCGNSYSVPVYFDLKKLETITPGKPADDAYPTTTIFPKLIDYPSEAKGTGYVTDTSIIMSYTNGYKKLFDNIQNLSPQSIVFHVSATPNLKPEDRVKRDNMFWDTSTVTNKLVFRLPIWFRSGGFGQSDTMDFDMFSNDPSSSNTTEIEKMDLRVSSSSDMPFDMKLQISFCNAKYDTLSSISAYIIKAGKIGDDGFVESPSDTTAIIRFEGAQKDSLISTKKMIYKLTMETPNFDINKDYPNVKPRTGNKIKLTFGFRIKPKITIKNDNKND